MLFILRDFFLCVAATAFFAVLMKVPRRAIPFCAVLGSIGYVVFELTSQALNIPIAGYFIGTLFLAVCSEILARRMKMPATIFVIPAIIPIVPGVGLYNTMLYLVEGKEAQASSTGIATILSIIAMAMALVITTLFTKSVTSVIKSTKSKA